MPNTSSREFLKQTGPALAAASTTGFPQDLLPERDETLGVALFGLGSDATSQLAPGLQETEHCELRGIITGSPGKIPVWQRRYDISDPNVYSYETLPQVANNNAIDMVCIVTPPGIHARDAI